MGGNDPFVFPATGIPAILAATMQISFIKDKYNQFYLQIVNGAPLGSCIFVTILIFLGGSGSLDIEFAYTFEGVDDPSNTYSELY